MSLALFDSNNQVEKLNLFINKDNDHSEKTKMLFEIAK